LFGMAKVKLRNPLSGLRRKNEKVY